MKAIYYKASRILILSLLIIIIFLIAFLFFGINTNNYSEGRELTFPRDGGRHEGYNESWYVGFFLISERGNEYSLISVYGRNKGNEIGYKLSSFTDVNKKNHYFKIYQEQPDDYYLDRQKLNITFDYFWGIDQWYQFDDNPPSYKYSGGLLDSHANPIILNCTMIDTKVPIEMKETYISSLITGSGDNNIFNYYAQTNIMVNGTLLLNESMINVTGKAWIDRQWGEELFPSSYDWFAIQLDNEYEIAAGKIKKKSGNFTYALLINPNGTKTDISDKIDIITLNLTDEGFTEKWCVKSIKWDFNLTITVAVEDQIINKFPAIYFFEGLCNISGVFQSEQVKGKCFSEQYL